MSSARFDVATIHSMLIDKPSWTDVQSANAAFSAMVASWVSAIATCLAVVFAGVAAYWAKGAVAEASRQANAATKSLRLATQEIDLLQKQIELSQPRPVILLRMQHHLRSIDAPVMGVENVGGDAAFDIQVGEIGWRSDTQELVAGFIPEVVLASGKSFGVVPDAEKFVSREMSVVNKEPFHLRQVLDFMAERKLETVPAVDAYKTYVIGSVSVTYSNVRGVPFEQRFDILVGGRMFVSCYPQGSLLDKSRSERLRP